MESMWSFNWHFPIVVLLSICFQLLQLPVRSLCLGDDPENPKEAPHESSKLARCPFLSSLFMFLISCHFLSFLIFPFHFPFIFLSCPFIYRSFLFMSFHFSSCSFHFAFVFPISVDCRFLWNSYVCIYTANVFSTNAETIILGAEMHLVRVEPSVVSCKWVLSKESVWTLLRKRLLNTVCISIISSRLTSPHFMSSHFILSHFRS